MAGGLAAGACVAWARAGAASRSAAAPIRSFFISSPSFRIEQPVLGAARRRQAEMGPAAAVEAASASSTGDKAQLDEEGLDHLLDRVARLAEAGGERLDPDRAAFVDVGDHVEVAAVHRVEAELVHLHPGER